MEKNYIWMNDERVSMSFDNLDTIVFYGQDFSPLENAYIGYSKDDSGTMVYKPIKNDPYSIRLLQAFS